LSRTVALKCGTAHRDLILDMPTLFSWLNTRRSGPFRGTLVDIFVAEAAGETMRRLEQVEATVGSGLAGDRYATGRGHWKRTDACQVTLIAEEDLQRAERRSELSFSAGEHRRNLVVRGIPLDAFRRRQIRIGEARFDFHRLRPPCGYLERLVGAGAMKALGKGAGICLTVSESGTIKVGDEVVILTEPNGPGP
jgi:MOSC domain-containing protein YiiM